VAEGVYEEVTDAIERQSALGLLATAEPAVLPATAEAPGVVFRLRLISKSGQFARRGSSGRSSEKG
jgi:hypothetical protein